MSIRISENYLGQMLVGDLNRSLSNLLELQRQAGSMRRVNDFADDPRAVAAIQRYSSLIANNDQYLRNIARSRVLIESADTALQDITSLLADARQLALRESSALATHESHQNATVEVDNLLDRLLEVLNTTVEGNYIFSGHKTTTPPFVRNGDTVIYQGDSGEIRTQTGPTTSLPVNLPGNVFLGSQSAVLNGTADLAPRLSGTTPLTDINLGRGWQPGTIAIRDGNNATWEVDLTAAASIDDVIAAINAETGGAVTAAIAASGRGLTLSGAGPLSAYDVEGGQAAVDLGLNATSGAGTLAGRDIRTAADATTLLTDVARLDGTLPLGTLEVDVDGTVYSVDLSGATTLGDVKSLFEAAVPGHELRLENAGLAVVSGAPTSFVVRNAGSPETASLLGIEGTGTPVRLFGVLEDLRAALEADDNGGIRGSLTEMAALEGLLQSQLIKVGGRQNDLDWADGILRQRDEQLQAKLSLERDADVAQVSADLAQAQMSYQSSLLVSSRLYQSNLMMYL